MESTPSSESSLSPSDSTMTAQQAAPPPKQQQQKRTADAAGLKPNGMRPTKSVKRRASKACQCCRSRKVRCNVVEHGAPCTNCRLDEVECIVSESKRKKSVSSLCVALKLKQPRRFDLTAADTVATGNGRLAPRGRRLPRRARATR